MSNKCKRPVDIKHNEFLGDAILKLVLVNLMFKMYPDFQFPRVVLMIEYLSSNFHLARVASTIHVIKNMRGRANEVEIIIGKIYKLCGYNTTEEFIKMYILTPWALANAVAKTSVKY